MFAVGAAAKGVIAKAQQRRLIGVRDEPDVSPAAAVAAVGTAFGNVGLAAKTDAAGPAVTRLGVKLSGVNEARHGLYLRFRPFEPYWAQLVAAPFALEVLIFQAPLKTHRD